MRRAIVPTPPHVSHVLFAKVSLSNARGGEALSGGCAVYYKPKPSDGTGVVSFQKLQSISESWEKPRGGGWARWTGGGIYEGEKKNLQP